MARFQGQNYKLSFTPFLTCWVKRYSFPVFEIGQCTCLLTFETIISRFLKTKVITYGILIKAGVIKVTIGFPNDWLNDDISNFFTTRVPSANIGLVFKPPKSTKHYSLLDYVYNLSSVPPWCIQDLRTQRRCHDCWPIPLKCLGPVRMIIGTARSILREFSTILRNVNPSLLWSLPCTWFAFILIWDAPRLLMYQTVLITKT